MSIRFGNLCGKNLSGFFLFIIILCFAGCVAVGPDYKAPQTSAPDKWNSQLKSGLKSDGSTSETLAKWWETFNDSELTSLIKRAEKGNLDLKKAKARIRQSRAQRNTAAADLFPSLNFSGSDTYSRTKETPPLGETTDKYTDDFSNVYSAGFDSTWEIDIFGGVRRSIEASEADYQSTQESLRDTLVSLTAEVALNYIDVRTYQSRILTIEKNLEAQSETYQLTKWRHQAGLTDELSVEQAKSTLESIRSQLPDLNTGLEKAMNRIAVLLGEQPGKIHEELKQNGNIPAAPETIAVGVPADIIRRRPDIRKAERDLAAQTARVGEATADLYPKLSLNGSIGVEALSYSSLGSKITKFNNYGISGGPQISWAVFKGGAIRQNIKAQDALQEQSLITYEAAILSALEDVENALISYSNEQEKIGLLNNAVEATEKSLELAKQEYSSGLTDFSNVLDSQRSLLSLQDQLNQSNGTIASDLVRLYKALGGGWASLIPDKKATL